MVDDHRVGQDAAARRTDKGRDRDTPHALTRETPVRTVRDHSVDTVLAPGRNPFDTIDLRQGLLAKMIDVHRDEPLLSRTEDHGVLTAPAVGIRVGERTMPQ